MVTLYVELATLYRDAGIKDLREIAKLATEVLNRTLFKLVGRAISIHYPPSKTSHQSLPPLRSGSDSLFFLLHRDIEIALPHETPTRSEAKGRRK